MPKMKTKKSIVKRFRRTARGKLVFTRPCKGHLNNGKSRKRKRHLRKPGVAVLADTRRLINFI